MTRVVVFGEPWFGEEEERLLLETLRSRWIGQGPLVERFEHRLERYLDVPHVVAVSSCTTALHMALLASGVGPGDEVITTPFTFVATVNAIEHCGATPVLVDVDPETFNLAPDDVARLITPRTRAVLPVHFGGRPIDTQGFYSLADSTDIWVIEDAAHALGAVDGGRLVGGSGHRRSLTCFSFYPNKNIASAEGGAVATSDPDIAHRLRRLRMHGLDVDAWERYREERYKPSLAVEAGFKANWTDLQAAIALPQLDRLEGFIAVREYLAALYDEGLEQIQRCTAVRRPPTTLRWRHALHLYQVAVEGGTGHRDAIVGSMRRDGVGAAVHYIGVNRHPYYESRFPAALPVSDRLSETLISLPLHPHLGRDDVAYVCESLARALK